MTRILNCIRNNDINIRFSELLSKVELNPDDIPVSFDVVALFTSVPVDLCVKVLSWKWGDISVNTPIKKDLFLEVIPFCLQNQGFQFDQKFHSQILSGIEYKVSVWNMSTIAFSSLKHPSFFDKLHTMLKNFNDRIVYLLFLTM